MRQYFIYNERLDIELPHLQDEWETIPPEMQQAILLKWEGIRGHIPDRIKELEHTINSKQHKLNHEENFEASCRLNTEIAGLASIINDLWLWYRLTQNVSEGKAHQ
ncbi:radical SAM protein [Bacillus manliponensis]|uniref:radical SAM protein n=1 Tax=Bacillus manliponensis TaxID=574376 RepID=UPI003519103B